ncbi:MAG: DUF1549 domain-containing protein [Paludisphaera borealis]|uniref:DUF1549 domain-containing protein n=1 Tax=Paludisphaera borealis TaxID=1387353 RepID=UPI00283B8395|nr:DUF1549 domain-containing protein [Paludisphaera borealis]MDR3621544.1 DUF1549 domain-containing protein [Paludisphaera borealis]
MLANVVVIDRDPSRRRRAASLLGLNALVAVSVLAAFGPRTIADDKPAAAPPKAEATAKAKPAPKPAKPAPPSPPRPKRTVTAPTITSADLDTQIAAFLAKNSPKVTPAPITSDVEFVRRVHFDVSGAPPTPEQVRSFVADSRTDKRARLIDELLGSPDHARNWARYWRDVVRFHATNQNVAQIRYDALEDWLSKQLQGNRPWDEIVADLITATGRNDENGAVAFALANEVKPVELAGEVSRVFMGVQIQCAQCHDHKTDSWKQQQFHEFAAFFAGARPRNVQKAMMGQRPVFAVEPLPRTRYSRPDNDDPKKQIPVSPRFFLSSSQSSQKLPDGMTTKQLRDLAASYVTGQDNPWFARSYVNRVWTVLMGEGFYDAVDDLGPERTAKAAEILEPLADQWQKGGYDVRWLFRTLLNTKTYQRRVRATASPAGKTQLASNCPSRLRSDQILEALELALGLPTETPATNDGKKAPVPAVLTSNGGPAKGKKAIEAAGLAGAPAAAKGQAKAVRAGGLRGSFNALFGADPSIAGDEVLGTIPQALFLMNGPVVHNRTQAKPGTVLGRILASAPDEKAALDALYLRVLSRRPTAKEVQICADHLAAVGNRNEAFEDIYWSLVNTTEFISRR